MPHEEPRTPPPGTDGETIAIGRRGEPEVVLTALRHDPTPRQLGTILTDEKGDPVWIDDDVDAPMPDVADAFEDSRVFPHP